MHATHGICPSIYVLSPFPRSFEGLGLHRYVVPSKLIAANEERWNINQKFIDGVSWSKITRNARPILSEVEEFIQDFAVREDDIIDGFRRFLEACPTSIDTSLRNLSGTNPREYASSQKEALRQYLPYLLGRVEFLKKMEEDNNVEE